ncbi:MAG: DUF2175 family protein [Vulcanisaeta sp. AZ3]
MFTFTNKGPVHVSCLRKVLAPKLYMNNTGAAIFELMTFANEGIIKVKNVRELIDDEDTRKLINDFRKTLEGFAAKLTNELVKHIDS